MDVVFLASLVILFFSASGILGMETEGCHSPQYLKIGGTGVVHCSFFTNFYGVLWFNSTETDLENPFIQLVDSEKGGAGYLMGLYDIFLNGSLIINKVSPVHDQTFTIVKFSSETKNPVSFSVVVVTTVISNVGHPVIAECGTEHRSCYTQLDDTSEVNCFIRDTRPAIPLKWLVRTAGIDRNVSSADVNVTCNAITCTSHLMTRNFFKYSTLLSLLVCKADSLRGMLREDESYIITENQDIVLDIQPVKTFIEQDFELKLSCSDLKVDILVWKKQEYFADNFEIIAFAYLPDLSENNFSKIFYDHYKLDEDGSLIVPHAHERDEGIYECSFENGLTGSKNLFAVVYGKQSTTKPLLWLLLLLIIPLVIAGIVVFKQYTTRKNQRYQMKHDQSETSMDEENPPDVNTPLKTSLSDERPEKQIEFTDIDGGQQEQVNQTSLQESSHSDLEIFREDLKTTYRSQYGSIRPVPSKTEPLYSVENVFVECNYEILISSKEEVGSETWEKVTSNTEILERIGASPLAVIEGGPGSGKSILTLKLAHDWCNNSESSPLHRKDILILLKMKDLLGEQSVSAAIKKSILPRDSRLTEADIEKIVQKCKSGVLILDECDGYPDQGTDLPSDIVSIFKGTKLQNYIVLVMTRSFFLLKSLPLHTRRIRLIGFNDKLRDEYIRKAIVQNDDNKVDEMQWHLKDVIGDFIQVPLIFVAFAHKFDEGVKFHSRTNVLKHVLGCFHGHMENKVVQQDVDILRSFKHEHHALDGIAFDIATRKHGTTWDKDEMCKLVGTSFYEIYLQCGIFVETEEKVPENGSVQNNSKVRLFQEVFCEWYAAHYLSKKLLESTLNMQDVEESMKPFKLRKVCLFASGINCDVGEKIKQYFEQKNGFRHFPLLCSVEMTQQFSAISANLQKALHETTIRKNEDISSLWSTFQLLLAASRNDIPIPCLTVEGCFNRVKLPQDPSETCLPVLNTLKQIVLREVETPMTDEELEHILAYSSMCVNLNFLTFSKCEMPTSIQVIHLSTLRARNVEVKWDAVTSKYRLNCHSGQWEYYDKRIRSSTANHEGDKQRKGSPVTRDGYVKEIKDIQQRKQRKERS